MKKLILSILTTTVIGLNFLTIAAQETELEETLPEEIEAFVNAGKKVTKFEKGDLNGDGTQDYILVLEEDICHDDDYYKTLKRTTVIVVRERDGNLRVAAHNEDVVFCLNCPDGSKDTFSDIFIDKNGFTIWNTVGKGERTIFKYSFVYSPRAKTWQLDKFEKRDYNIFTNRERTREYYAPRNFARINFTNFDPSKFKPKK